MPDADKIIDVPGVGHVSFPSSMADAEIGNAIQTHMLKTGQGMEHPIAPYPKVSPLPPDKMAPLGPDAKPLASPLPLPFSAGAAGVVPTLKAVGRGVIGSGLGAYTGNKVGAYLHMPELGEAVGGLAGAVTFGSGKGRIPEWTGLDFLNEPKMPDMNVPAAREEMYNDLAERRMRRGTEQGQMDSTNEARLAAVEKARLKELADAERFRTQHGQSLNRREAEPEPFTPYGPTRVNPEDLVEPPMTPMGPTRINETPGGFMPPSPFETVTPHGPTRINTEEIDPASLPGHMTPMGPTRINTESMPSMEGPQKIVTPERAAAERAQPRVGNEGSAARWKNSDAMRILRDSASSRADKQEAAMTLTRRGIQLPENYRYLLGDEAPGSVVYNPRDVTRFTAGGETVPIKQGGKWKPMP